jgi:hypothetical protein
LYLFKHKSSNNNKKKHIKFNIFINTSLRFKLYLLQTFYNNLFCQHRVFPLISLILLFRNFPLNIHQFFLILLIKIFKSLLI